MSCVYFIIFGSYRLLTVINIPIRNISVGCLGINCYNIADCEIGKLLTVKLLLFT